MEEGISHQQQLLNWVGGLGNGRIVSGGSIRFETKFPAQDFLLELNSVRYAGMERVRYNSSEPFAIYITFRPQFTDRNRKISLALEWRKKMSKFELEIANKQLQQSRQLSETQSSSKRKTRKDRKADTTDNRPDLSSSTPEIPASKTAPTGITFSG